MEESQQYETFLRNRITELRTRKNVSEHRMSLDLGKSGSYIRSITNGMSLPSLRELFNIISYFDLQHHKRDESPILAGTVQHHQLF